VKQKSAKPLGRAGLLVWEMEYVTAVDGTRIPIELIGRQNGSNRVAVLAGGALATGALVFPYTSPIALIWALKKGDEAVLRGNRSFFAILGDERQIAGLQPRPAGVVYRDRDTVKASSAPPTNTSFPRGSFRPGGSQR
jgi:hypothetical protein